MANQTGDPRGPGMPGTGGFLPVGTQQEPVVIRSTSGDAAWDMQDISPLVGRYIQEDETLDLVCVSNVVTTIRVSYKILRMDGTVLVANETRLVLTPRVTQTNLFQLCEGFLISMLVSPATFISSSQYLYAEAFIKRPGGQVVDHELLMMGYCTFLCPMSFPPLASHRSTDAAGALRSITGSTPAVGAEINEVVPAGTRWRLLSLRASLQTSAVVANRQPQLLLDDGVNIFYQTPQGPAQAASLTWAYGFSPLGQANVQTNTQVEIQYDNAQILTTGMRIRTLTANIGADQWSAPQYIVLEWADNI